MKRYNLLITTRNPDRLPSCEILESPDGEWVKWEDVKNLPEELTNEIAKILSVESIIERLKKTYGKDFDINTLGMFGRIL